MAPAGFSAYDPFVFRRLREWWSEPRRFEEPSRDEHDERAADATLEEAITPPAVGFDGRPLKKNTAGFLGGNTMP